MQEQLISFENAKLAKEKGFNGKCHYWIHKKDFIFKERIFPGINKYYQDGPMFYNWNDNEFSLSIPTQSLLQKWLRDVHKIYVYVNPTTYGEEGRYSAQIDGYGKRGIFSSPLIDGFTIYNSYEEALEEGLQEALKLINN